MDFNDQIIKLREQSQPGILPKTGQVIIGVKRQPGFWQVESRAGDGQFLLRPVDGKTGSIDLTREPLTAPPSAVWNVEIIAENIAELRDLIPYLPASGEKTVELDQLVKEESSDDRPTETIAEPTATNPATPFINNIVSHLSDRDGVWLVEMIFENNDVWLREVNPETGHPDLVSPPLTVHKSELTGAQVLAKNLKEYKSKLT